MFLSRKITNDTLDRVMFYILFLTSIDTCVFGTNTSSMFRLVPRIVGFIFIIFVIFKGRVFNFNKKITYVFATMAIIQTVSSVVNHEEMVTYVSRLVFFLVAYMVVSAYTFEKFAKYFVEFLFLISIVALVLEVIAYIIPSLIMALPQVVNTEGQVFYSCFFGAIHKNSFNSLLIRSSSIFWEPGAYAVYLVFALIIEWFCKDKFNFKRSIVFLIALLTTFSTTGYIAVFILMIAFMFTKTEMRSKKEIKVLFGVIFICMIAALLTPNSELYQMIFAKIQNESSGAVTRYSSLYNGMKVALEHPLLGVASNTEMHMSEIISASDAKFTNGGVIITNTIVGQFACYGVIYGLMYCFGLFKFCKKINNGKFLWISILLAIAACFSGERFFSYFAYVWMLYGYKAESFE